MLTVVVVMLGGVLCGHLLKGKAVVKVAGRLVLWVIYLLLLLLGLAVGKDAVIMERLGSLGGQAALLALGAVLGSAVAAGALYRWLFNKKKGA